MTTPIQPYPAPRAPQLDYSGRRHARMTKSMKALPRAVLQILTELRYSIRDGETQTISNAVLAQRTGLSEGFVSAAVRWLAGEAIPYVPQLAQPSTHVFIERHLRQDSMPGYEITMLPPPELRPRQARSFFRDHSRDPLPHTAHTASGRSETLQQGDHDSDPSIFCIQTENQQTNQESPPNVIVMGGGTQLSADETERETAPADTPILSPALQAIPPACDENHQDQLAPELIAGHQALNPERAIFPGEWYELLALQATHGTEKLLTWQARAARRAAGQPSRVLPGYYRACAAHAAVDSYRPRRHSPTPESAPTLDIKPPPPPPATRLLSAPALDPACDALLRAMGIRECAPLAHIPLALIEQWARVIDHPGLAARFDDVRAFAHAQLCRGNAPPSRTELERWAERARSRAAAAPALALTDDQIAAIQARQEAIEARAATLAPPDITCDERLALLADLERGMADTEALERLHAGRAVVVAPEPSPEQICAQLLEDLQAPLHRRLHPLLQHLTLQVTNDELRIVCSHVGQIGIVEADIAPHIRVALQSYAWQPCVRVVAQAPPVAPPAPEPAPPAWIGSERWATLPGLLKTMLLESVLEDGALRCVSPGLTRQVQARYGEMLAALLAERHGEAEDATT